MRPRAMWMIGLLVAYAGRLMAAEALERDFAAKVRPLLAAYCHECHAKDVTEAEIDLARFATVADVRRQVKTWLRIRDVVHTGDMPPKDARQPTDAERQALLAWVRALLAEEAQARAGDPGPVGLRRLDNAEYTYVLRDLTGVAALDPAREFPVDGAAGEGFTNVASGQGMSPAMVQKYLDAAKDVATHLVLLPDGIRFSEATTERDQTDELLARIQAFYRRFTADGGGTAVNLQGIKFETNQGGRLPVERYLRATLQDREALRAGRTTVAEVARGHDLNVRYLQTLWDALTDRSAGVHSEGADLLLGRFRKQWEQAQPADAGALAKLVAESQQALWKFNPVGQVGRQGGPSRWMDPVSPLAPSHDLRLKLNEVDSAGDIVLYLTVDDLGDGPAHEAAVLRQPRLEFPVENGQPAQPPVLLKDVRRLTAEINRLFARELPRTEQYLAALVESRRDWKPLEDIARAQQLHPRLLDQWSQLTGLAGGASRRIDGHFTQKIIKAQGYDALNGWGRAETPSLLTNSSEQPLTILTLTVPARGVTVHPSPTQEAFVAWRSPIAGRLRVEGLVADADDKCGNGAAWRVDHRSVAGSTAVAQGVIDNGGKNNFQSTEPITVAAGDVVVLSIGPRDGNHVCDTTHIELTLAELNGEQRVWRLSHDVIDQIASGNPVPDRLGHPEVWHFGSAGVQGSSPEQLPEDSALANWRSAVLANRNAGALAAGVAQALAVERPDELSDSDRELREWLRDWKGPLRWIAVAQASLADSPAPSATAYGLDAALFGTAPDGAVIHGGDLALAAPQIVPIRLPATLAEGAEFVARVELFRVGSVQVRAVTERPATLAPSLSEPILVAPDSADARRWEAACQRFRDLFPAALCYSRIVPVDEVVTLTLFHREDDHLRRLMLDDAQTAELERLWDELYFVSQEPLKLVVALEQLIQFATQDRQDLVPPFQAMQGPVGERAERFRRRLLDAEPAQVAAVITFAERAWRRPLTGDEQQHLREVYARLRRHELSHADAVKLTLASVLTAPEFLFKLERTPAGSQPAPVSPRELAQRLSFFLWSSIPDDELLAAADSGRLTDPAELIRQAQRMRRDPRTRRMAVHFACQWLHVRDFAHANDKNERLFPEFAGLRGAMFEETVLFFEDLFRNNGSVLSVLDADHTFLNEALARHYGIDWAAATAAVPEGHVPVGSDGWRRVTGLRPAGRGGMLGMATILASQSGASRTSPILRGNWVFETVLGEKLPKPPPGVPQLPEAPPSGLTERQMIEQHSSVLACARCHIKIDPYGFALEQFDAIGRRRPQPVDTRTTLVGGEVIDGLDGLRSYLANQRRADFLRQFCRKLLGYALGRETQLSDEPLLDALQQRLAAGEYRFSVAVEAIVTSPQFRQIRGADNAASE